MAGHVEQDGYGRSHGLFAGVDRLAASAGDKTLFGVERRKPGAVSDGARRTADFGMGTASMNNSVTYPSMNKATMELHQAMTANAPSSSAVCGLLSQNRVPQESHAFDLQDSAGMKKTYREVSAAFGGGVVDRKPLVSRDYSYAAAPPAIGRHA